MPTNSYVTLDKSLALRVHVPNSWVRRIWVIVIIVLVLGKHTAIRYLDP